MSRSKPPVQPRKLSAEQIQCARKCAKMRVLYPSFRRLAKLWQCDEATIRRAVDRLVD